MFTCWRHKTANPHITAEAYGPHSLIFSRVFAVKTSQLCLKNMPMSRERVILTPELELGSKVQNDPPWDFYPWLNPKFENNSDPLIELFLLLMQLQGNLKRTVSRLLLTAVDKTTPH